MKKYRQRQAWRACCLLLAGLILGPGSGPEASAGGLPPRETPGPVAEAALFAQELSASGALKFYDNTEALLRAGQFERALLRYRYLRSQISRQAGYEPLVIMVNRRLDFLRGQLKLPAGDFAALRAPRVQRQQPEQRGAAPPAPAPSPSAKVQSLPAANEGDSVPTGETGLSSGAGSSPAQGDSTTPPPQAPATQGKPASPQVEEEKTPEPPPPPPPSRWQRLKRRLLFWRR